MSKNRTNQDQIRIQFLERKGTKNFKNLQEIFKIYPNKKSSDSIRQALNDLILLFKMYGTSDFGVLLKKINIGDKNDNKKHIRAKA